MDDSSQQLAADADALQMTGCSRQPQQAANSTILTLY